MTGQVPTRRKQQKRGEKTVRRVLDAARSLLVEGGFEAALLAEISRRSGVPIGSLYHHFGSKEGILGRMIEEFSEQAKEDMAAIDLGDAAFEERLRGLLNLLCAQFRNNPELYRSMAQRVNALPEIWVPLRGIRIYFESWMRDELSEGLRERGIRDPEYAIHRMTQTILGLLTHSVVFGSAPVNVQDPNLEDEVFAIGLALILLPTPERNDAHV